MSFGRYFCIMAFSLCAASLFAASRQGFRMDAVVKAQLGVDSGNCVQKVHGNVPTDNKVGVPFPHGKVQWIAQNTMTSCKITFNNNAAECPFYVNGQNYCEYECTNGRVKSKRATGSPKDSKYLYKSVLINGQACQVGTNGIVLDH
jgi:hypothetical protein